MQTVISIRDELVQRVRQATLLTHFKNMGEFVEFLIEEKIKETENQKNDPIFRMRGMLKGKIGGTELFMQDKQSEIQKEYAG
ncbi:MAG: hypothetical protein V2I97_17170 [Desulfococcaceae bacterium]|jgi:hypothetical protein|nr:hypothetical protein [Desulfococcaceae bacterium]